MKILHTADLHLGTKWREHTRAVDQARVLDEILGICDRHDVDLLLVAGDVFGDRVEGAIAREAKRLLDRLRPHLRRGRAVFLLRGNHDPAHLFALIGTLVAEMGGERWPLVVAAEPGVYPIPRRALQVVALPYLTPAALRQVADERDVSPEERTAGLAGLLALVADGLFRQAAADVPAVFAGHVLISGANLTPDREVESGYARELWLQPAHLPPFTSYNALGHIHLHQEVRGTGKPTWYAGAPERLNLGEREYRPAVLLVTTPEAPGGVATVESIGLTTCTPFVQAELAGEEEIEHFCACWVDAEPCSPLGLVTIADVPVGRRGVVEARLRDVAPRVEIRWVVEQEPLGDGLGDGFDPHDVSAVVGDFLERAYADQPDRRARLARAFAELWSEGVPS